MKNKLKKTMTALCAALILMGGFSVPAYAQGAATEPPAGDATNDSNVVVEEKEETPPLTPKEMKRRDTPNSPNRTHFMVELSPTFMQLASSKDTDRLFSMLPYKTLSFSKIEGRHGTYALIDKNENRGTDIRRVRPSIRAQLAADKRKAAPKKAAVKSKNHELEV